MGIRCRPYLLGNRIALAPRRILRTCRENIAYNTLPYKFARMLPLPLLVPAQRQTFLPIDALDALVIHTEAIATYHSVQSWTAPPLPLLGQGSQPCAVLRAPSLSLPVPVNRLHSKYIILAGETGAAPGAGCGERHSTI
jgi:hypothetical protein